MTLWRLLLAFMAALGLKGCISGTQPAAQGTSFAHRHNVLDIVSDDPGFSDIAQYGGEIATPILSWLAQQGIGLTQLHSAQSCSPSWNCDAALIDDMMAIWQDYVREQGLNEAAHLGQMSIAGQSAHAEEVQ